MAGLALSAHFLDSNVLRAVCAFVVLALLGASAARTLRVPLAGLAIVALALLTRYGSGTLLDALPALIAAFVAWSSRARSARAEPLIARAIAKLDGEARLHDAQVRRYARGSLVWAGNQMLLASAAALPADSRRRMRCHQVSGSRVWRRDPAGRRDRPGAWRILLRPRLLPQAHSGLAALLAG